MEKYLLIAILAFIIMLAILYPAMLLWNYVMPVLGVAQLTYWQIVGFWVLTRLFITDWSTKGT